MKVRKKGVNKRRNLNCLEGLYLHNSISRIKRFGLAFLFYQLPGVELHFNVSV